MRKIRAYGIGRSTGRILLSLLLLSFFITATAFADEVLDWNAVVYRSIATAATAGALQPRQAAIVHVAMFDALNGIERRYTPIHVTAEAPRGASRRAAVAQAAYTALVGLFPTQQPALAEDLARSLAGIAADSAIENSVSIQRGIEWGTQVANEILAWRATDGLQVILPPYLGSTDVGKWRPTPRQQGPGLPELPGLPGFAPQMATMEPFVIPRPYSFRPQGPPALTSAQYAADVNEVKLVGEATSTARTADQTQSALFWAATGPSFWNRAATTASLDRHLTLSQNARLFALLNVAMADSLIAVWDSKYYFSFWRPITAIRLASTDGNPATIEQANWVPLLVTPPYPEYYSGHQGAARAAAVVMIAFFGNNTPVQGFSEGLPGVTRSWPNYSSVADESYMARIWAGIHYRFTMEDTKVVTQELTTYILEHAAQPLK